MKSSQLFIIALIIICGSIICLYFYFLQPANNFSANEKADANEYLKIYEYFQGDHEWKNVRFGIHNRIVIPFLASLFPNENASLNFFALNSILAILSLLTLYLLLAQLNFEQKQILPILLFFSFHYLGPFRQNAVGPINVDVGVYLLEILFLWLLIKRKFIPLIIIIPIAVATKEVFLAITVVIFFLGLSCRIIFKDKSFSMPLLFMMLFIGLITKWMLNEIFPSTSPGRNSILVMAFHFRELILNPEHFWRWILSLFAAYGGFLFLLLKKYNYTGFNSYDSWIIYTLSLAVLSLSILGGMDYARLIFLGFPYVIISIFLLSNPGIKTIWLATVMSLLLARFWVKMPAISLNLSPYNSWMPESANLNYLLIWSLVLALSFGVFYFINRRLINPN